MQWIRSVKEGEGEGEGGMRWRWRGIFGTKVGFGMRDGGFVEGRGKRDSFGFLFECKRKGVEGLGNYLPTFGDVR